MRNGTLAQLKKDSIIRRNPYDNALHKCNTLSIPSETKLSWRTQLRL